MATEKQLNPSKKLRDAVKWSKNGGNRGNASKPRVGWNREYDDNYDDIFRKNKK